MSPFIVPIVAIISTMVVLPAIIVFSRLGGKALKLKERELDLRELELANERERLATLRVIEENERSERLLGDERQRLRG